ncbi:hypothetical protein [Novosphingobium sp. JCM 18896]|uniref:hypothetical protein n=1 Tax=Novosphingobium sp. JCM 18896 TaxID=2989731 RepID=UPI002223B82B|nr:hypothetical protein [Novosphingobium sp. JCM 18896]
MAGYSGLMSDAAANPRATESVEARLRGALDQGDVVLGTVAPVLRHLLASDDSGLFGDAILARVRGMIGDVARQLMARVEGGDGDLAALTLALTDNPAFLGHVHALVLEWHLTELLQARLAFDPVLSPLLQALVASSDETTAALAMKFLAAQARFGQAQRRMRLALAELPGDLLHAALVALRGVAGGSAEADQRAAAAEAAIRADYDEARSRLGLLSRLVTGMGAGAVAALSLHHAGAAIFLTALAVSARQDRDLATLATSETQRTRLALALCAAGLKPEAIEEQLLALDPDAELPEGIDRLAPDRAAALIAGAGH